MNLTTMLQQLIATNSISSVVPSIDQSNREVIDLLANWLDGLGFQIEIMPLADSRKANLIATLGAGPGGLVLSGHTDTVPCDPQLWQQDPFKLVEADNRFYGLGICDMKGFFALAIEAIKPFLDKPLQQPLIILATADEESSMAGAEALVAAGKPLARSAVIGEPTGLRPIAMHKGVMFRRLEIRGQSGHSSNPSLGRNAMETMHKAITELLSLRSELQAKYKNPLFSVAEPTLNLGCIHGGDNPNRICGHCELGFDIRPLPGMDIQELHRQVEQRLLPLAEQDQVDIALYSDSTVPPFAAAENSPLVALCEKLTHHERGAVTFGTEAPYLSELGMDVVVLGPGDIEQAHQPNEFLDLNRIKPTVELLTQLIRQHCL